MSVWGTGQDPGQGNEATSASSLIASQARQVPVVLTQTKTYVAETKCHAGGGESKPRTHQLMSRESLSATRQNLSSVGDVFTRAPFTVSEVEIAPCLETERKLA